MGVVLLIDQDQTAIDVLGHAALERGVGVALAETLSEGVRTLLATPVSLIVIDHALLRLSAREHAVLFERVAPRVPVVVLVRPGTPLETRLSFELAGFRVRTRPVAFEDLIAKAPRSP